MLRIIFVSLCFFIFQLNGMSQTDTTSVKTIEGIVNKMLEIISGEVNEPRDWDEYRNLFLPTAQKMVIKPNAKRKRDRVRAMNIEEFIRYVGPLYGRDGFIEVEIGLTINEFNGIANVFQSYHAKNLLGTYEKKGINSYQLVYLDDRWWIASTTWASETADNKIPNKYLNEEHQTKE